MKLALLHAAFAVSEARNLPAAATELGRAASSISARVSTLEHRIGARLFERTAEGFVPTPAGAHLQRLAPPVVEDIAFTLRYLRAGVRDPIRSITIALDARIPLGSPIRRALRSAARIVADRWPHLHARIALGDWTRDGPDDGMLVGLGEAEGDAVRDRWAAVPASLARDLGWSWWGADARPGAPKAEEASSEDGSVVLPSLAVPTWVRPTRFLAPSRDGPCWQLRLGRALGGDAEAEAVRGIALDRMRPCVSGRCDGAGSHPTAAADLLDLRCAVLAFENGNLSRAAQALGIAQAAATVRLRKLEGWLGAQLFARSPRGLAPTDRGDAFHRLMAPHLRDLNRVLAEVAAMSRPSAPSLRIGLVPALDEASLLAEALAEAAAKWRATAPRHRLHVVEAVNTDLRRQVLSGLLDLAVVDDDEPQAGLVVRRLATEPLCVLRGAGRPNETWDGGPGRLRFAALEQLRLVLPSARHGLRAILDRTARSAGVALRPEVEIDSMPTAVRMVRGGDWATVLPLSAVRGAVSEGRLRADRIVDPQPERRLSVVRRSGEALHDVALHFVALFAQHVRAVLEERLPTDRSASQRSSGAVVARGRA